jgi:hypothetical protein
VQGAGFRFKVQGSDEIRIRDSGSGIQDQGFRIRDSGSGIRDQGFEIRDSRSGISD